jgi:hypothetical protein
MSLYTHEQIREIFRWVLRFRKHLSFISLVYWLAETVRGFNYTLNNRWEHRATSWVVASHSWSHTVVICYDTQNSCNGPSQGLQLLTQHNREDITASNGIRARDSCDTYTHAY